MPSRSMVGAQWWPALVGAGALVLMGCPPQHPCPDGGVWSEDDQDCIADVKLVADYCNSPDEALADSTHCLLTVNTAGGLVKKDDVYISTLADGGVDRDWYVAPMPATMGPRSLLHVAAGYSVAQTAVNFSVNVLQQLPDGGLKSVVQGIDPHGTAAPKPVDLIVPFSTPSVNLFVQCGDGSSGLQPHVDNIAPYSVFVQVMDNPDTNEPNDSTATPITLAAGGGGQQGTSSGYLATPNDVDLYSFQVPNGPRQIIYLHITGPTEYTTTVPAPPYRLSYVLYDDKMTSVSEGVVNNRFAKIDLSTARLASAAAAAGAPVTYTLKVTGYRESGMATDVGGDLDVKYTVQVLLLPDVDTNEPNDTFATAKPESVGFNGSASLTGKLSYVPDEEWFVFNLPAQATASTFRYALTVAQAGGRFAPLSPTPSRQLRYFTTVTTGTTSQDRQQNCINSDSACHKGYDTSVTGTGQQDLVTAICKTNDPPLCLYAERDEVLLPSSTSIKNLVGAIPVPANKAVALYFMFRDQGQGLLKYADDRDWTLKVDWVADPDEQGRGPGATAVSVSPAQGSAPGVLTYGYGDVLGKSFDITDGTGIRGPDDYDAYPSDKDLFEFDFSGATGDQTWEISWELGKNDAGVLPGQLALDMTWCSPTGPVGDGGLCSGEKRFTFGDNQSDTAPWYQAPPYSALQPGQMLFSRQETATSTIVTAKPVGCWCVNKAWIPAGKMFANLGAYNRITNDPITYTVRTRLSAYPGSYAGDGGTVSCPTFDAGCGWAP